MPEQMITLDLSLFAAGLNLAVAALLGALIGSERQMRQRMAGLRTNALVALGAAGFVTFAALFPHDMSPTRVAAQVVSGIGFLGAGIIFRDGFNVHGLNTAATLWCSAAVGLMAGTGHLPYAALLTGLIVFINLALRPIVGLINKLTRAKQPKERMFQIRLRCARSDEQDMRTFVVRNLGVNNLYLHAIEVQGDDKEVNIIAHIHGEGATERNALAVNRSGSRWNRITRTYWCAMVDRVRSIRWRVSGSYLQGQDHSRVRAGCNDRPGDNVFRLVRSCRWHSDQSGTYRRSKRSHCRCGTGGSTVRDAGGHAKPDARLYDVGLGGHPVAQSGPQKRSEILTVAE